MCCKSNNIEFLSPINGACLNARDGKEGKTGLIIPVSVKADKNKEIYINSIKAPEKDGVYTAECKLIGWKNFILVENKTDEISDKISVFWIQDGVNKYRISSDDNIIFLQDITKNKDVYKSIFENPYLAVYKKAHDLYGAKIHINLFYEFDDHARSLFSKDREYFNLSMMTDKFKDEFKANSDWLKLSFHAYSEFPDKPYEFETREKITSDCLKIVKEILRFAGEDSLSDTATIHWGEATKECVRGLRSLGIRYIPGYFDKDGNEYIVSLYLKHDPKNCEHLSKRDFWYDEEQDVFFVKIDCVTNIGTLDEVMENIKKVVKDENRGAFVSFMIHEQYFYADYINHKPDFEKRVLEPAKYLVEHGYVGAHVNDILQEPHHRQVKAFRK